MKSTYKFKTRATAFVVAVIFIISIFIADLLRIQIIDADEYSTKNIYYSTANTQIKALANEVEFELSKTGVEPLHTEGYGSNEWVLLDYGSLIVHVFYKTARDYYKLERLWADGTELPLTDFIKAEEIEKDEI